MYNGWTESSEVAKARWERWSAANEEALARAYAAEQADANLRAGSEVIARLDAEAQALELQAEADWLDLKRTQADALGTLY